MKTTWHFFSDRTATVVLVGLLVLSGCGGKEQRMAKYMEKGKTYLANEDYDKARVEIKNVLQIDPKYAEAYFVAGQIEEKVQAWPKAFGNYLKTTELDPNHLPAKVKLGRLYLLSGDMAKTEQLIKEVLAKQPTHAGGRTLKAALLVRKGDIEAGIREVSQVVESDPTQVEAVSLLATLFNKKGDETQAKAVLEKGIKSNPKEIALRFELATLAIKRKDLAAAEGLYREIVALEPKRLQHRLVLASFYARTNQLDKGEQVLREAIQADPDDQQRYLLLADFLASRRSGDAAEKELLSMIQANPKLYKLRFGLAKLYEAMNQPSKATEVYQAVVAADKVGPDGLNARNQQARLNMIKGNTADAGKLIAEVLKENPRDNEALVMRSKIALSKGDAKNAIVDIRAVLKDQPDSLDMVGLLSQAHMMNKEPQLAKEALANLLSRQPNNSNVRLAMADFLMATKDIDGALKEVNTVVAADPKNASASQAKAEILSAKQDWAGAEAAMTKVKELLPDQPVGYYRLGLIYQAQKKFDKAIAEFDLAIAKSPKSVEPLNASVAILVSKGQHEKAIARINQVLAADPNNIAAHLMLGETYANQKKMAEAQAEFRKVIGINPRVQAAYIGLSVVQSFLGDAKAAIATLEQGLAAVPDDARLATSLAESYQRMGANDKAIATYDALLTKQPKLDVAANNLASILIDYKGDKPSLDKALTLAKRFESSENPAFLDTLGWAYYKLGQYDLALPFLKKSVEKAPQAQILHYHFGAALYKKGDMKLAKEHLQKSLAGDGKFPGAEDAKAMLAKL